jgi:uncharacterized repeat protein (TIGR01451 family)
VADSGALCAVGPGIASPYTDVVNIPAGKKITYTVVATVNLAATGDMTNSVTVYAPAAVPDPILGNNTATDMDVHPTADLVVTMTDMVVTYVPGMGVIYTITVTNIGPSNVTGAIFSDAIPTQVDLWTWTCAPDLGALCAAGPMASAVAFSDTVNIPVGKRIVYTVSAHISGGASGSMTNTASIMAPLPLFPDPNMGDNTASDIDNP